MGEKYISIQKTILILSSFETTDREYYNPEAFACVLGALAEGDFLDIVSNGSVGLDGTGAYSVSHVNGINMDFKYFRTDKKRAGVDLNIDPILVGSSLLDIERQNLFLDALKKFGFGTIKHNLSHKTAKNKLLNYCKEDAGHKDHLHIQGFKAKYN